MDVSISLAKTMALVLLGLVCIGNMSGCASISKERCQRGDWNKIGYEDGLKGYPASRIDEHSEECRKYNVALNAGQYNAGRARGLQSYCTAAHGYKVGLSGARYYNVCTGNAGVAFVNAYQTGKTILVARNRVNAYLKNINQKYQRLDEITGTMHKLREENQSTVISRGRHHELEARIDKFHRESKQLKSSIRELELQAGYAVDDLNNLYAKDPYASHAPQAKLVSRLAQYEQRRHVPRHPRHRKQPARQAGTYTLPQAPASPGYTWFWDNFKKVMISHYNVQCSDPAAARYDRARNMSLLDKSLQHSVLGNFRCHTRAISHNVCQPTGAPFTAVLECVLPTSSGSVSFGTLVGCNKKSRNVACKVLHKPALKNISLHQLPAKLRARPGPMPYKFYRKTHHTVVTKQNRNSISRRDEFRFASFNVSECEKMRGVKLTVRGDAYTRCIGQLAILTGKAAYCEKLRRPGANGDWAVKGCVANIARMRGAPALCFKIKRDKNIWNEAFRHSNTFSECVSLAILNHPSYEGCKLLQQTLDDNPVMADECYLHLGQQSGNRKVCGKIIFPGYRQECLSGR
jgi:hypothetical protein